MNKKTRDLIKSKYNNKCAYCGCELQKGWHIDHIEPIYRNWEDKHFEKSKLKRGQDSIENYNPACPRCNRWKGTWSIEQFRHEISMQTERLKRDSPQFRMAFDYGIIKETGVKVVFYFESF